MASSVLRALVLGFGLLVAFGGSVAQTPEPGIEAPAPADENAALLARSQALGEAEREQARQLFSTGFTLWQSAEYGAAEAAFRDGLAIDPANAPANFYYGDVLLRRENAEGEAYMRRAIAFGGASSEVYRAQAALTARETARVEAEQSAQRLVESLTGAWRFRLACTPRGGANLNLRFSSVDTSAGSFMTEMGACHDGYGRIDAEGLEFGCTYWNGNPQQFQGRLTSPTTMSGTFAARAIQCTWTAEKQ